MAIWFIILASATLIFGIAFLLLNREWKDLDEDARKEMDGQFVLLEKGIVHYILEGDPKAPLVILIHGFSTPSYTWEPTCQALNEAGFQTLRFDLFGRGASDRPEVDYTVDLFVEELEQLVSALKIDRPFHLVGLSMGGPISAAYANRNSEHLQSLTLVDPVVDNIFCKSAGPMKIPILGEILMAYYLAPFVLCPSQSDDLCHPELFPNWEEQFKGQMRYKGFRRAILSTIRCMADEDFIAIYLKLAEKKLPILIIRGEEDRTISLESIQHLREIVPNHRFRVIPDAGHIPHYEKPEFVNEILLDFISI